MIICIGIEPVQTVKGAMQVRTEKFGKIEVSFLTKNCAPISSRFRLSRCSRLLADVPRVLCGIFCKFAWEYTVKVGHIAGAASRSYDYAVEIDVVQVPL